MPIYSVVGWTRFTPAQGTLPQQWRTDGAVDRHIPRQAWKMTASRLAPGQARKAILDYANLVELPRQLLDDVLLCVSEAVSNVVFHAYRDADLDGSIDIEASVDRDLRICVRDHGSGFAMHPGSPGSGLGLPIMSRLTRTFHIRTMTERGGTEVIMRFALPPASD